jgi:hypothetical protein
VIRFLKTVFWGSMMFVPVNVFMHDETQTNHVVASNSPIMEAGPLHVVPASLPVLNLTPKQREQKSSTGRTRRMHVLSHVCSGLFQLSASGSCLLLPCIKGHGRPGVRAQRST